MSLKSVRIQRPRRNRLERPNALAAICRELDDARRENDGLRARLERLESYLMPDRYWPAGDRA